MEACLKSVPSNKSANLDVIPSEVWKLIALNEEFLSTDCRLFFNLGKRKMLTFCCKNYQQLTFC